MMNDNVTMTKTPEYSEPTYTEDEWVDYPYLGIGKRPNKKHTLTCADIDKIIDG